MAEFTPTFRHLGGTYVTKTGRIRQLAMGDPQPEDAAKGEIERLAGHDAWTTPRVVEEAAGELPTASDAVLAWMTDNKPKVSLVLEMVGEDLELAQAALEAEFAITNGDPRTSLVSKLEELLEAGTKPEDDAKSDGEGAGDTKPEDAAKPQGDGDGSGDGAKE